jgi:hypothetical protein
MHSQTHPQPIHSFVPIDDLECSLVASYREVSRATHHFLKLLREFDLRQGYKPYGNNDCAEWLNWRCGISRGTAQEKVRVARALWHLPQIDKAFKQGHLSYSKVRAITRVAGERNEAALLEYALSASSADLEAYCSRLRNGDTDLSPADAKRLHEGRYLTKHYRRDGTGVLTVELPKASLDLVVQALDHVVAQLPEDADRSIFAAGADALLAIAQASLLNQVPETALGAQSTQVVVHVDNNALAGRGGEADEPLPTIKRMCCDGGIVPMLKSSTGEILNVGRKQRAVPTAIKRALVARDRTCRFPGCHYTRFLDAHHIVHWADGGETSLGNLVLLCTHHHTLLHEGGYQLRKHADGKQFFTRPDGRPVEVRAIPALSAESNGPGAIDSEFP